MIVVGAEESEGFVTEKSDDCTPYLWSDGGCVGHSVAGKEGMECFMREWKAEVGWK